MCEDGFSESQIVAALKQAGAGMPVKVIGRQAGISVATDYQWKRKDGGLDASERRCVKALATDIDVQLKLIRVVHLRLTRYASVSLTLDFFLVVLFSPFSDSDTGKFCCLVAVLVLKRQDWFPVSTMWQ